jgi:hypothetical protein
MLNKFSPAGLLWGTFVTAILLITAIFHPAFAQDNPLRYIPQPGTPVGIPNFVQPEQGCSWAGIGGQVFDLDGQPVSGLVVKVEGEIDGQEILLYSVSGGNTQIGPGGYLMKIADAPLASNGRLFLQVVNIDGTKISERIQLNTVPECNASLLLVNVRAIEFLNPIFLPVVGK